MALLATNAMAASGIQPKYVEVGALAIVCTQAIASGAASDGHYALFKVASGMTIVDCVSRMATAINATNSYYHIGIASGGKTLVSSASNGYTYPARGGADCTLPYTCTADTTIIATLGAASTAISSLIVVATVMSGDNMD
jgi:hypothetical protein